MGLAGYQTPDQLDKLGREFNKAGSQTYFPLPGVNLQATLNNPKIPICYPDGERTDQRNEILFVTDDTITNHLKDEAPTRAYKQFIKSVAEYKHDSQHRLKEGPVVQPNHIRCVKWTVVDEVKGQANTTWKLARYWDPEGNKEDQWEFYSMDNDPAERINLVTWKDSKAVLVPARVPSEWGLDLQQLKQLLDISITRLGELEQRYLAPVSPFEEAYVLHSSKS